MIQDIITTLENISNNKENQPLYILGGYIVGATLVRDDYEDIIADYPSLEVIAELGAELETLENMEDANPIFEQFQRALIDLKRTVDKNDNPIRTNPRTKPPRSTPSHEVRAS